MPRTYVGKLVTLKMGVGSRVGGKLPQVIFNLRQDFSVNIVHFDPWVDGVQSQHCTSRYFPEKLIKC